jgi:uncharacterized Zn finger protein (UPF0148 family)
MEANREKIICPNCGTEIDVNEILYHQLEDQITSQFEAQLKAERAAIGEKERAIEATRAELASKLENSQAAIDQAVRQQTKSSENNWLRRRQRPPGKSRRIPSNNYARSSMRSPNE